MILLTPRQFDVLKVFYEEEQADRFLPTINQIALKLGIQRATAYRHINALIKKDFLKKLRSGQFSRNYRLTEAGTKLVEDHRG